MSTRRVRRFLLIGIQAFAITLPVQAQTWDTWLQDPGNPKYVRPDYVVAFVATEGHSDPVTETPPHFGLDVISANNPAAHGPGGGLWALLPDGQVKKLFPLPEHENIEDLFDTPLGQLEKGAVVEPNMSEDGKTLYFAYFHDATWKPNGGGWQSMKVSYKGADLYRMNVSQLLEDFNVDPATLPVKRLTFKQYTGPAKSDVFQTTQDKFSQAINPSLPGNSLLSYWGTADIHLIEMRTNTGLKAVWSSNRTRTGNSNPWITDANHNFSLYMADIFQDGSLGSPRQLQYYTTTSALSPIPLRNGLAFSYQSTTNEPRRWDIQWLDSEGRWVPLLGYAHSIELFHLGTMVVDPDGEDWFIGVKYYNLNDGGFGNMHKVRLANAGTNAFVPGPHGTQPRQLSTQLPIGAVSVDVPSPQVSVDGQLEYIGKFSSPRAGRMGGEYLMAYTPTSANRWLLDADGNKGVFESHIAYRPNLEPFRPHETIDVPNGKGLYTVIRDATDRYDLVWPTPLLSWNERTGEPRQRVARPIIDSDTSIPAGMPFARVGTSAIYNTDVRPYDCYIDGTGTRPYNPNSLNANTHEQIVGAFDGLRYVQDPDDFCGYVQPETVLGISINTTSNRTDLSFLNNEGYWTTGLRRKKESVELIGTFSTIDENAADQSFMARIPADTPFEFHLLEKNYGMNLVDVRSWHSLKPRETRNDCGGCHQHEAGFAIPFAGTEASRKEPMDMTLTTQYVAYDADCKPTIEVSNTPTVQLPEWTQDIWPQFSQHCSPCHDLTVSSNIPALTAYDFADEESAYTAMLARNYANDTIGALGSPAFWAAYGKRTDGRDNTLAEYQPDYAGADWGYFFSSVHATTPGLCAASNATWAEWVRKLGVWIDHHMPRNTGSGNGFKFDRFHPTVDLAFAGGDSRNLRIGWWDNSNSVDVTVELNGTPILQFGSQPNGSHISAVPPGLHGSDLIKVVVMDGTGNRQFKEKSLRELYLEAKGPPHRRELPLPQGMVRESDWAGRALSPRRIGPKARPKPVGPTRASGSERRRQSAPPPAANLTFGHEADPR